MTNLEIARRAAARHWPTNSVAHANIIAGGCDNAGQITTAVAALEMRDSVAAELAGALKELVCATQDFGADRENPHIVAARAALAKWEAGK